MSPIWEGYWERLTHLHRFLSSQWPLLLEGRSLAPGASATLMDCRRLSNSLQREICLFLQGWVFWLCFLTVWREDWSFGDDLGSKIVWEVIPRDTHREYYHWGQLGCSFSDYPLGDSVEPSVLRHWQVRKVGYLSPKSHPTLAEGHSWGLSLQSSHVKA